MLNQHRHTVIPESDHLRIGDCVLDLPRREITHGDATMRITVKSLQVLLVLVSQQGKVVSREALIEWVWADTMPSDDVLTQAITQLRKAFGDDRGAPRYLETIAKGGYRLLAPVEWILPPPTLRVVPSSPPPQPAPDTELDSESALAAVATPPAPPSSSRAMAPLAAAGAVLLVALLAGFGYRMLQTRHAAPSAASATPSPPAMVPAKLGFQRITSSAASEMWPSLSPDGSQVVYVRYADESDSAYLMAQTTAPVPAHPLTQPVPGVLDTMPAWSPNGREIAFTRIGPKDACSLMVMPALGGDARAISKCRPGWEGGFSWHPDGRHLVTSQTGPDMDGALYTIDLATGAWTRLDYQRDPHDTDLAPTYSPDGRWIAFHRNVSVSDLWRVPATGGKPERLTNLGTNINSIAWAPDGKSIVFGMYLDGNVTLARLDLTSRRVTDLGVPKTLAVSVAAKVPSAAFVITDPHSAIFSIDLANPGAGAQPVFPSTGVDLLPAIAPDGTQIAFVSDRSAVVGLWWARSDRPESLRLVDGVIPIPRYAPVWSADSTRVLVIGRTDADRGLYEVAVESGSVRHLPVPAGDPVQADYLPDPSRLLVVADRGAGRLAVTLYDRSTTPWKALRTLDDISLARLDGPRNRVLFTRASTAGLWQADTELRGVSKISERPAFGGGRRLIFSRDKVELVAPSETCGMELVVIEHESQPPRCLYKPPLALSGVSLDAVHNRLYYSSEKDDNSDIGWLHLPRLADDAAKPAVAGLVTR